MSGHQSVDGDGADFYLKARLAMVAALGESIRDERVLGAFASVRREQFVPAAVRRHAYANSPLPIGHGQTISQPLVVAIMLEALQLQGHERVLDVGTGSGYQAALLAELAAYVVSVERIEALARSADITLRQLAYANVTVEVAGPALGWPAGAPYDAIIVAAAAPEIPDSLVDQLAVGGRLILPIGERSRAQELVLVRKTATAIETETRGPCSFVPLIGDEAFEG